MRRKVNAKSTQGIYSIKIEKQTNNIMFPLIK